jgi:SAM-dependent methyltransferase
VSIEHLHALRDAELASALAWMPAPAGSVRILDLGAGTGRQAARLAALGYAVTAVDLPTSAYAGDRVHPVTEYDGRTLPFGDGTFDVVFSSNVLEHVHPLDGLLRETARVLAPGGRCVHLLPTPAWRCWTTVTYYPWLMTRALSLLFTPRDAGAAMQRVGTRRGRLEMLWPARHGERGNVITESRYFSESWWRAAFARAGFRVLATGPAGLAYTGSMLLGARLAIPVRRLAAPLLGSACRIYVLCPDKMPETDNRHRA